MWAHSSARPGWESCEKSGEAEECSHCWLSSPGDWDLSSGACCQSCTTLTHWDGPPGNLSLMWCQHPPGDPWPPRRLSLSLLGILSGICSRGASMGTCPGWGPWWRHTMWMPETQRGGSHLPFTLLQVPTQQHWQSRLSAFYVAALMRLIRLFHNNIGA